MNLLAGPTGHSVEKVHSQHLPAVARQIVMREFLALLALATLSRAQMPHIGDINFYGLHKVTAEKILSATGLRPGGPLPGSRGDLEDAIEISSVSNVNAWVAVARKIFSEVEQVGHVKMHEDLGVVATTRLMDEVDGFVIQIEGKDFGERDAGPVDAELN